SSDLLQEVLRPVGRQFLEDVPDLVGLDCIGGGESDGALQAGGRKERPVLDLFGEPVEERTVQGLGERLGGGGAAQEGFQRRGKGQDAALLGKPCGKRGGCLLPRTIGGVEGVNDRFGQEGGKWASRDLRHLVEHRIRRQADVLKRDRVGSRGGQVAEALGELRHVPSPSTFIFVSPQWPAVC